MENRILCGTWVDKLAHIPRDNTVAGFRLEVEIHNNMVWTHTPPPNDEDNSYMEERTPARALMMGHLLIGQQLWRGKFPTSFLTS